MAATFRASDLVIERSEQLREIPAPETLGFGRHFTDHMLIIDWDATSGWGKPHIKPYGPFSLDPASYVLHYATSCFEGMKAYYGVQDGKGRLFRPERNMARLKRSMERLSFPTAWDEDELLECIKALLRVDRRWLPAREGYTIYVRPFAFASHAGLGLMAASRVTIACILSPSGPYYAQGLKPLDLFVNEVHVRAWPGGAGDRKVASNYGPTVLPGLTAQQMHGCAQVLYLLPRTQDSLDATLSEVGTMNIFLVLDLGDGRVELATPPLEGTILPGITRDSLLEIARGFDGVQVSERNVTLRELVAAAGEGRLLEAFGAGTAAVVSPVQRFKREGGAVLTCKRDMEGRDTLTWRLYEAVTAIHFGKVAHPWSVPFE